MGTTVDNEQGPGVYSGDLGAPAFGYVVSQKASGRYDQSPMTGGDHESVAEAWHAATISKAAWLDYHQQHHATVYSYLMALTDGERTKMWELAKFQAEAAEHFAGL